MQALETDSCCIAAALRVDNDRFDRDHFLAVALSGFMTSRNPWPLTG
jgi:hypothetical protein